MQARKLKALLNNTDYIVHGTDDHVCVGSPMCHDLLSVDKKNLTIRYALDTFNEGRGALQRESQKELLFIYDKLHELIASGEIKDIIDGDDEIENPIPIYTYNDGVIISTFTDNFEWPNTDAEGRLIYHNTYFLEKTGAIKEAINEANAYIKMYEEKLVRLEKESSETVEKVNSRKSSLERLTKMLEEQFT